jgi:hypothetical protein
MAIINITDPNDTLIVGTNKPTDENLVPELQNQVPYVELVVYRNKVADYYVAENGEIKEYITQQAAPIPLMGYDPSTNVYENNFENDSDVYQNFGISSIDINIKSKFIPTVNIKFIDVRGQSTFNTDTKTSNAGYRSLFDLPPATYVLKVKGVFGNIVRYDLHLLKTNSTFNSTNGNFEIACEFVGKSFIPLTDIKLGWIKAVSRMNTGNIDSSNTNNGSDVNNFQDLIWQTKQMYSDIRKLVNGSKETETLKTDETNKNLCVAFQKDLTYRYGSRLNKSNDTPQQIYRNKGFEITGTIFETTYLVIEQEIAKTGKTYDEFYGFAYETNSNNITPVLETLQQEFTTYKNQIKKYNKEKYKDLGITIDDTDLKAYYTKSTQPLETITVYYDYTALNKKIVDVLNKTQNELTKTATDLDSKISNIVNDTVGFELKISKVFDILMTDTSKFLKLLKESGDISDDRRNLVNSGTGSIKQDVPLVAYPRVINAKNETIYPGEIEQFKNWKEVKFVETFLDAYLATLRIDKEFQDSLANSDDSPREYIPLGTLDFNSLKYKSTPSIDEIFSNLFTRYYILSQYTYKGEWEEGTLSLKTTIFSNSRKNFFNSLYKFLGESESENVCRNLFDLTLLKQFKTNLTNIKNEKDKNGLQYFIKNVNSFKQTVPVLKNGLQPNRGTIIDGNVISINKAQTNFQNLFIVSKPKVFDATTLDRTKQEPTAYLQDSVFSFFDSFSLFKKSDIEKIGIEKITANNVILIEDKLYNENPDNYYSDFFKNRTLASKDNAILDLSREYGLSNNKDEIFIFLDETNKDETYFGQSSYDNRDSLLNLLKDKFLLPSIVEIPKITAINIGRLITIDSTFLNELSKNDKQIFIDLYNEYIKAGTPSEIKKLLDTYVLNLTDWDKIHEILKDKLPKTSIVYELMSPIYIQNNSAYTFLLPEESNGVETKNVFFPLITGETEQYNTLDTPTQPAGTDINAKIKIFLDAFISNSLKIINEKIKTIETTEKDLSSKIKDNDVKRQIYYSFKNLYDKWLSDDVKIPNVNGNNNGYLENIFLNYQDQFQFVDRALRDIGTEMVVDIEPLIEAVESGPDTSLYTGISLLLSKNNFEFFPLPNLIKYDDKNQWSDVFKLNTFLETTNRTQFTCMYIGGYSTSKDDYVSFTDNKPTDFTNDTAGIVNSFNVYYGKQNQMIFQDIKLTTTDIKETGESLALVDKIFQNNGTTTPVIKTQSLFEVYEKRAYACEMTIPLGNTCIQPTCYFELKNVQMFNGCYIILEVNHNIDSGTNCVKTTIKGTRIGKFPPPIITKLIVLINGVESGIAKTIAENSTNRDTSNDKLVNPDFKNTITKQWSRIPGKQTPSIIRYNGKTSEFIFK